MTSYSCLLQSRVSPSSPPNPSFCGAGLRQGSAALRDCAHSPLPLPRSPQLSASPHWVLKVPLGRGAQPGKGAQLGGQRQDAKRKESDPIGWAD